MVRTLWSPSGKHFITGSYDYNVCVYRSVLTDTIHLICIHTISSSPTTLTILHTILTVMLFLIFSNSKDDSSSEYKLTQRLEQGGAVESLAFAKVLAIHACMHSSCIFVVRVYYLPTYVHH